MLVAAIAVAVVFAILYVRSRAQTKRLLRKISQRDTPDTLLPDLQPPPRRAGDSYLFLCYDSRTHRQSQLAARNPVARWGTIEVARLVGRLG